MLCSEEGKGRGGEGEGGEGMGQEDGRDRGRDPSVTTDAVLSTHYCVSELVNVHCAPVKPANSSKSHN